MKKTAVLSFLLLFLIVFSALLYYINSRNDSGHTGEALSNAFNESGAAAVSSEVYIWGRPEECNNINDIRQLAEEFLPVLGLRSSDMEKSNTISNYRIQKLELTGITDRGRVISLTIQIVKMGEDAGDKSVTVSIVQDLSGEGLDDVRQSVEKVFKKHKIDTKVNYCITGSFNGKLDTQSMNEAGIRIFNRIEAKKVHGIRDRNLISVSAYSPLMGDAIKVNGQKSNLNLAIRYNSYEDKTYIWLATPVITTEY